MRVYAICLCIISISLFGCGGKSTSEGDQPQITTLAEIQSVPSLQSSNEDDSTNEASDQLVEDGCVIQGVAVSTVASQLECEALIALYDSLDGQNWNNTYTNWNTATDPCDWDRVTCNDIGVKALSLYDYQLSGDIPPEIGDLTNLQFINFSINSITGLIPPELSKLNNLQHLFLNKNQLSGVIPVGLEQLVKLQDLSLFENQLSGTVPMELKSLSELNNLRLADNNLSGVIPSELGDLNKLKILTLSGNQLSGSVPESLGKLTRLEALWLHHNQLTGQIPESLSNLQDLGSVLLHSNQLSGDVTWLTTLTDTVEFINLSSNGCFSTGDLTLAAWLDENTSGWDSGC